MGEDEGSKIGWGAQTTEKEMLRKELARDDVGQEASEEVLYKIDIPANRYDMLCLEGIARALNIFNGRLESVQYRLADMSGGSSDMPARVGKGGVLKLCEPFGSNRVVHFREVGGFESRQVLSGEKEGSLDAKKKSVMGRVHACLSRGEVLTSALKS